MLTVPLRMPASAKFSRTPAAVLRPEADGTVTLALYEALIRRFDLLRILFGMKRLGVRRRGAASSSAPG